MSVVDQVIESVMDMIDEMDNFAKIRRGALSTSNSLVCEIAPSSVDHVFMDKNAVIALDLTINGKHANLQTLSNTLNNIVDTLTRRKTFPSGDNWELVDIARGAPPVPTVIDREQNSDWLMAASVIIRFYRKDDV